MSFFDSHPVVFTIIVLPVVCTLCVCIMATVVRLTKP